MSSVFVQSIHINQIFNYGKNNKLILNRRFKIIQLSRE